MYLVPAKSIGQLCKNVHSKACKDHSAAKQCFLQLQAIYRKRMGSETLLCAINRLYMTALIASRSQQHFFQEEFTTCWPTAATPFLSNAVIVAVVHSHGRWLRWGLSQHGRSCVYLQPSSEWMKSRPSVVNGEQTEHSESGKILEQCFCALR